MRLYSLKKLKVYFITLLCVFATLATRASMANNHLVAMRMIGHQLLLAGGDDSTRVKPVTLEFEKYRIAFENDLSIVPDSLVDIVARVVAQTDLPFEYMIQVEECSTQDIVYALQVGNTDQSTLIPCRGRDLPKGCYQILLSFSSQATTQSQDPSGGFTWKKLGYGLIGFICIGAVILFFFFRRNRTKSPSSLHLKLGKYRFDKLNAKLIFAEQHIELTSKEADLLFLLFDNVNNTVERDVILNKVWGDEGDYIGRTLDVFISKLRKKLELDPSVKITNVRGVGYKLVLSN